MVFMMLILCIILYIAKHSVRPVMQHFWSNGSPCECPESKCVTLHSNMEIKWKMENCNQKNIFICRNRKTIIKGNIRLTAWLTLKFLDIY